MNSLIQLFRGLSEETRLRIVMLLTHGELCVCDLMAILGEPQSKISRHLAYLNHSGITSSKRVGVWMHYRIKQTLDRAYQNQLNFLKEQFSSLPQFPQDKEKMLDLKRRGGCKAMMPLKSARLSTNRFKPPKQALQS